MAPQVGYMMECYRASPADVLAALSAFDAHDGRERRSVERTLDLLQTSERPFARDEFDPGHVTASAVVVSSAGSRALLVFHRRLARWLQPGGHIEPEDETLVDAARREVAEETGLVLASPVGRGPVGVDVHRIPAASSEPDHWHYDLVYGFLVDGCPSVRSPEGRPAAWCPVSDLRSWGADRAVLRAVRRVVDGLRT